MKIRFNPEHYESIREDLVEEAAKEYIKDGLTSEDAWEKAEQDTPTPYDLYEDAQAEYADIQYELMRDRKLGL